MCSSFDWTRLIANRALRNSLLKKLQTQTAPMESRRTTYQTRRPHSPKMVVAQPRNDVNEFVGIDPQARCYFYLDPSGDWDLDGVHLLTRKRRTRKWKKKALINPTALSKKSAMMPRALIGKQEKSKPPQSI